jgi:hypothetical protein
MVFSHIISSRGADEQQSCRQKQLVWEQAEPSFPLQSIPFALFKLFKSVLLLRSSCENEPFDAPQQLLYFFPLPH